jgi:hypothetical protein
MERIGQLLEMFMGDRIGGGGGIDLVLHNVTHIDGNGIINDRELESAIRYAMVSRVCISDLSTIKVE